MYVLKQLLSLGLGLFVASASLAQEQKPAIYEGAASCKKCHLTQKSGAAYKIWQGTKHAQAYQTLASPAALEIGKKLGIAEPQKSEKCLQCHVTAFGVDANRLGAKFSIEEGVGCEACHGPGSEYDAKTVMEGITNGSVKAASVGLIKPTEKDCVKCHNEKSPSYKPFNFEKMAKEIAHPRPKAN